MITVYTSLQFFSEKNLKEHSNHGSNKTKLIKKDFE